jgi:hypothetical protein
VTYAYIDENGTVVPLPRILNVDDYLDYITNRTWPEFSSDIKVALEGLWSSSAAPGGDTLTDQFECVACDLGLITTGHQLAKQVFAISIKDFMDTYTDGALLRLQQRGLQRGRPCVHVQEAFG